MWDFDPFAAVSKYIFGNKAANVVRNVNFQKDVTPYVKDPNRDRTRMLNNTGNRMIRQGRQRIADQAIDQNNNRIYATSDAGTYDPAAAAAAEAAAEKAEEEARRNKLRGESYNTLDELMQAYEQIVEMIGKVGKDQTGRLNKDYDQKVAGQITDMNNGMYDTDAAAAANNLADSSFRSFDRGKVRKAADSNIETLNKSRENDISAVGQMVATDTAKYEADKDGIGRTRRLIGDEEDIDELQATANNLDSTLRGTRAARAKYGTRGEFVAKANKLGNYDTTALEQSLQSVVDNASADPSTKMGTIDDLLNGVNALDDDEKNKLRTKYTQKIG